MPAGLKMRSLATKSGLTSGLLIGLLIHGVAAHAANPNALWQIVHGRCVPNERQHGDPRPCVEVDLRPGVGRGFAVLKDRNGATQFLLIPTKRISGIESRSVRTPDAVNYFAAAWRARGLVANILGHAMARDRLSLAVNSMFGRTQNQLHIHIDCLRADVREALHRRRFAIGRRWRPLDELLAGHRYRAMRVTGRSLAGHNPFSLLARGVPGAGMDMGRHTLVVVGMRFPGQTPGFVILDHRADPARGDDASGEELQDHACALGH